MVKKIKDEPEEFQKRLEKAQELKAIKEKKKLEIRNITHLEGNLEWIMKRVIFSEETDINPQTIIPTAIFYKGEIR